MEQHIVLSLTQDDFRGILKETIQEALESALNVVEENKEAEVLLSRHEAAELLKVSLVTISKYQKDGIIPYYRFGRRVLFKKKELIESLKGSVRYRKLRL